MVKNIALVLAGILIAVGATHLLGHRRSAPKYEGEFKKVENFALLTIEGEPFELYRRRNKKLMAIISHGNGCPVVREQIPHLNELFEKYSPRGVDFILLNGNLHDSPEALRKEAAELNIRLPIIKDPSQNILRALAIERTGMAYLIDPADWRIVYQGAISDQFGYSAEKTAARKKFLENAITEFLAGDSISTQKTEAVGCAIQFEDEHRKVTFKDVAPILSRKCAVCHQEGGTPPVQMVTLKDWRGWARMSREQIRTMRMPPWALDTNLRPMKLDASLSAEEKRMLLNWFESPMDEANEEQKIPPPGPLPSWKGGLTVKFELPESFRTTPANIQPYLIKQIAGPLEKDLWVEAIKLNTSPLSAIHHIDLMVRPEPLEKYDLRRGTMSSTGVDPKDNYRNFALNKSRLYPVFDVPEGTGILFPKGSYLILETHPANTGKPETINVQMELKLVHPARIKKIAPLQIGILLKKNFSVPAHAENLRMTQSTTLKSKIALYGAQLHGHLRTRQIIFWAKDQNGRRDLISAPWYNPKRQGAWQFETPIELSSGTEIGIDCIYDNTEMNPFNPDANAHVKYGLQVETEEMCKAAYKFSSLYETLKR